MISKLYIFAHTIRKGSSKIEGNEQEAYVDGQVEASEAAREGGPRPGAVARGLRGVSGGGKASRAAGCPLSPVLLHTHRPSLLPLPSLCTPCSPRGRSEQKARPGQSRKEKSRNSGGSHQRRAGLGRGEAAVTQSPGRRAALRTAPDLPGLRTPAGAHTRIQALRTCDPGSSSLFGLKRLMVSQGKAPEAPHEVGGGLQEESVFTADSRVTLGRSVGNGNGI